MGITTSKSSALSIFTPLIFKMQLINGALFLNASSVKQTILAQSFTCDFLIYKKHTRKPQKCLPIPSKHPHDCPFLLKNNYIYNHIKKHTCKTDTFLPVPNIHTTSFHTKNNFKRNNMNKKKHDILTISHKPLYKQFS